MFSRSYFSATATWVGLVITTSALGTSCIMRRWAIWRWIWRILPFTSGSPSLCLNSSFTSCLVTEEFITRDGVYRCFDVARYLPPRPPWHSTWYRKGQADALPSLYRDQQGTLSRGGHRQRGGHRSPSP